MGSTWLSRRERLAAAVVSSTSRAAHQRSASSRKRSWAPAGSTYSPRVLSPSTWAKNAASWTRGTPQRLPSRSPAGDPAEAAHR
jgi:hypothetical protein